MNKLILIGLIIITILSLGFSACNSTMITTSTETPSSIISSTTTSLALFTRWESKILAPEMFFQNSIAGTINGKNYLFCNAINGPSAKQGSHNLTLVVLDITSPDNPNEISSLQTGLEAHPLALNLKLYGTTLYVVTDNNLWIIDVSDPNQPKEVGQIPLVSGYIQISVKNAYVLSYNQTNGLVIDTFDISDPVHPVIIGQITLPDTSIVAMGISGSLLLTLADNGLYIYDISIPSSLKQIGFMANPFPPVTAAAPEFIPTDFFNMAIEGNQVYITTGINHLLAIDISNPVTPKIICDLKTAEQGMQILVSGKMAYMLSCNGAVAFSEGIRNFLAVVDISIPNNLKELNSISLPTANIANGFESYANMIELGNHLYFSDNLSPVFQIIELSKSPWD
jgi:hypothetical protein